MHLTLAVFLCLVVSITSGAAFNVIAFYDGTYDAAHINFVHEAIKWFPEHAAANNFTYKSTNNWNDMNANNLKNYQVVMFLDAVTGDNNQRQAFQHYMENGGAWIGFHFCAYADKANVWPWFHNTFLGSGLFKSNTWWPTSAKLHIEAPDHPAMKGIPDKFVSSKSEWYSWSNDLRKDPNIQVLATIDNSSFPQGTDPNQQWHSGYYPIIWTSKKFKMIYANFGHDYMDYAKNVSLSSTFESNDQNKFLLQALNWLAAK
jgi:hypothetical protein